MTFHSFADYKTHYYPSKQAFNPYALSPEAFGAWLAHKLMRDYTEAVRAAIADLPKQTRATDCIARCSLVQCSW